MVVKVALLNII